MEKLEIEPLPVNERLRDSQTPSGIKNIGNSKFFGLFLACYFSSLVQVLFHLPNMQEKILNFEPGSKFSNLVDPMQAAKMSEKEK